MLTATAAGSADGGGSVEAAPEKAAVVDQVADGDTIQVQIGGREEDVRFIGIDTPEIYREVECAAGPEVGDPGEDLLGRCGGCLVQVECGPARSFLGCALLTLVV